MALGQEANTGTFNEPGLYRDPDSGAELEVSMSAGADALVRMGWKLIRPVQETSPAEAALEVPAQSESTNSDTFSQTTTAKGITQYRKNGKLTSQSDYEQNVAT
jgi:hypothetical protein